MRIDFRHYARDLALAATPFGAAQSLKALANIKNPKFVLDPSSQAVAGLSMGARRTTASTRI